MALNARNFTHHRQLNKGLCGDNGELANRIKDQMKSMLLELSSNKQTSLRAVKQGVHSSLWEKGNVKGSLCLTAYGNIQSATHLLRRTGR